MAIDIFESRFKSHVFAQEATKDSCKAVNVSQSWIS